MVIESSSNLRSIIQFEKYHALKTVKAKIILNYYYAKIPCVIHLHPQKHNISYGKILIIQFNFDPHNF